MVIAWDEQGVPMEERPVVQEGDGDLILKDDVRGLVPGDDLAEAAIGVVFGHWKGTLARSPQNAAEAILSPRITPPPPHRVRGGVAGGLGVNLIDATRPRSSSKIRSLGLALALLVGLLILVSGPSGADAGVPHKDGRYRGATVQATVTPSYRALQFTVKKGKVRLTGEPVVAKGLCLSTPVFTVDGTPTRKLSGRGRFTFTRTFIGSKFDRISGRFVSPTEVEGFVVYHFQTQDLCAGGKTKVRFSAKHA
jgi:hypothetical protein